MKVVLLGVGIDAGCVVCPVLCSNMARLSSLPIPDPLGIDKRTYGVAGKTGHWGVLSPKLAESMATHAIHLDPEFDTFTYGDPTPPKRGLVRSWPGISWFSTRAGRAGIAYMRP